MMAPPGPAVEPGGRSLPSLEEETPTGISRSPTCLMMILRFARRVVVASAAVSFACQSGRIASEQSSRRLALLSHYSTILFCYQLTTCDHIRILMPKALAFVSCSSHSLCTFLCLFPGLVRTFCHSCSACSVGVPCEKPLCRCFVNDAKVGLLAVGTCCRLT